jgi:hypothetical protein
MAYTPPKPDLVDAGNSSTALLIANATFTGTAVDCTASAISCVTVFCFSDQASAVNGMQLQWSEDGTNWDHIQKTTAMASISCVLNDKVRARYYRAVHINGAVNQGVFRLQTIQSATNTSGTIRDLGSEVFQTDEAQLCRSVLTGKSSTGLATPTNTYTDVITDVYGSQQVVIGGQAADAFGRLRSANPMSLFDAQFSYTNQPLLFQTSVVGAGTVAKTSGQSSLTLSTGSGTSGDGAINQSKQYCHYEPGKSQQIIMSGVLGAKKSNVRSRIGYFDANDGVYFEMDGTAGASVNVRSSTSGSPVNTSVTQANWNFDKMDGTGVSGITLDFSKAQVFAMDFQWLGEGRVRFGFFVNGVLLVCHQIYSANVISVPYMNTANLPVRAEIFNTGAAGTATTMLQVCMAVISEGGAENPQAYQFSASNGTTTISGISTRQPLITIRPKVTFNSITDRCRINVTDFDVFNNATPGAFYELIYNGTLSGGAGTFTSVDANSVTEFNVDRTGCTGGTVISQGYCPGGGKTTTTVPFNMNLPITLDIGGTIPDTLTLCVSSTGTNIVAAGAMRWLELR